MDAEPAGCPPEDDLRAFHSGALPEPQCDRVATHLADCTRCALFVELLTTPYILARLRDEYRSSADNLDRRMRSACDRLALDPSDDELRVLLEENTDYKVGVVLGSGGMGRVYAGTAKDGSGRVALKVILPRFAGIRSYLARFEAEAVTLRMLDHPRVVRYLKLLRVGSCPVLVMEHVAGQSLHVVLRDRGPLPVAEAIRHARSLLEALQYLNSFGVVHRDVKPGNCLVTEAGEVKLVDFGIAKDLTATDELTETGRFVGTPCYMSPEQAARPREVDSRSDLYSAGCVLYELLTGRPPFRGEPMVVIGEHATRAPKPPHVLAPDTPRALSRVVLRLLAKLPAERYQSPAEAIAALTPELWEPRPRRFPRTLFWATGVLVMIALVAVGVAYAPPPELQVVEPPEIALTEDVLTLEGEQTRWFGSESWKDCELQVEAMAVGGGDCPLIYFRAANNGNFSCLRMGARKGKYLYFEEAAGGKAAERLHLSAFDTEPGRWYRLKIAIQRFDATCTIDDAPCFPDPLQLTRSNGRIGLGAERGAVCRFRNLTVRDRAGTVLWAGFGS